jgi:hypothetical protein
LQAEEDMSRDKVYEDSKTEQIHAEWRGMSPEEQDLMHRELGKKVEHAIQNLVHNAASIYLSA